MNYLHLRHFRALSLRKQQGPFRPWSFSLKVHKHEIFLNTFFAETETIWSQGPVTRDFKKSYSNWQRYSTFKHFRACSACDEIGS